MTADSRSPEFVRVGVVAAEMHHLLWNAERSVRDNGLAWWNCGEVAAMTAALMWLNGCEVDVWGGHAFFVQSPKSDGAAPCLHHVPRHWWMSVKNIGVVDFSPDLSVASDGWDSCSLDYIFANKVIARQTWQLHQANNMDSVNKKLRPLQVRRDRFACIYLRQAKKSFTGEGFLSDRLISNQNKDPDASAALLCHLDKLLHGTAQSLTDLPLLDAWNIIRTGPECEREAIASRFR